MGHEIVDGLPVLHASIQAARATGHGMAEHLSEQDGEEGICAFYLFNAVFLFMKSA